MSYMTGDGFLLGDLVVSSTTTLGGWLEAPLPGEVGERLRSVPGVRAVEGWRVLFGQRYRDERIAFFAADDTYLDPGRISQRWYREGDARLAAAELHAGRGVAVSIGFAERFGLGLGQVLELETPTGIVDLPVVGVVRDYLSDRGTVIMSRALLERHWHETGVSRFHIYVDAGVAPAVVRDRIAAALQDRHLVKVLSLAEVAAYQGAAIDRAFAFTDAIQLLMVIVAVVGIFDLLLATITERRRELALWRLIGADDRAVRRSITMESTAIGVIAAMLGSVVGLLTAALWVTLNFPALLGFRLEYVVPWRTLGWYVVLSVATTVLAGRLAAREGTRAAIIECLRPE
jgi:putative ABC transport system permease protein